MNARRIRMALATASMVALAVVGGFGGAGVADAAAVGLSVSCYSNPERTTIRNNTSHGITVYTVGSTYRPYSYEPFHVNKHLNAGAKITYQTGSAAFSHVLTHTYIYNNNGLDGAKVTTSAGTFKRHC